MINEQKLAYYCCGDVTEIENYEDAVNDTTQTWECHHREGLKYSMEELIDLELYYNRPPSELIFLTQSEHSSLHHKGKKVTDATRENISKSLKGIPLTAEHRENISKASKGKKLSAEHCENISKSKKGNNNAKGNKNTKGMHWYNNGIENKLTYDCPEGFVKGMLKK